MNAHTNIAVLISGNGSNLQSLIDATEQGYIPAKIDLVVANKDSAYGLERAIKAGIACKVYTDPDFERDLQQKLEERGIELICLAGFTKILSGDFVSQWRGRIINIHPSLLPLFGGRGMYGSRVHRAVLESEEVQSGATVHFVSEACDKGEVILQQSIPVHPQDTIESLAKRVQELEHRIYPEALRLVLQKIKNGQ